MFTYRRHALCAVLCLLVSPWLSAGKLRHMNLEALSNNAGSIFRGTLVGLAQGSVEAGGGTLLTTTYRFSVSEGYKGHFSSEKGFIEMTVLNKAQQSAGNESGFIHASILPDPPKFRLGQEYLIFATTPSRIGLSTTVGLGQGCFHISRQSGVETAVNEFSNFGLFRGMAGERSASLKGAMTYDDLIGNLSALLKPGGN